MNICSLSEHWRTLDSIEILIFRFIIYFHTCSTYNEAVCRSKQNCHSLERGYNTFIIPCFLFLTTLKSWGSRDAAYQLLVLATISKANINSGIPGIPNISFHAVSSLKFNFDTSLKKIQRIWNMVHTHQHKVCTKITGI